MSQTAAFSPLGRAADEDTISLRVVSRKREIPRNEARLLWKEGRAVGLFNVPNEEVFDHCQDFCIESEDDSSLDLLVQRHPSMQKIKAGMEKLLSSKLLLRRELEAARAELRKAQGELAESHASSLLQEENYLRLIAEKDAVIRNLKLQRANEKRETVEIVAREKRTSPRSSIESAEKEITSLQLQKRILERRIMQLEEDRDRIQSVQPPAGLESNGRVGFLYDRPSEREEGVSMAVEGPELTERLNQQLLSSYLSFVSQDYEKERSLNATSLEENVDLENEEDWIYE